jgi:hypothetical protein
MSEYQYYEFQAVDRPLTPTEMAELRKRSTRARITSTRFQNVYHWGDLKGQPLDWVERYFDAFVYVANWGTNQFMVRLPRRLLDPRRALPYEAEDSLQVHTPGDFVILEFISHDDEGGYWIEDEEAESWMPALLPVRAELASGDLRALYLAWLAGAVGLLDEETDEIDDEAIEPPVPPGLRQLSASLTALASFLRVSDDLLAVAAVASADLPEAPPPGDLERWLAELPAAEKDALLLRLTNEPEHARAELLQRHRQEFAPPPEASAGRRTVADLLAAAEERAEISRRQEAERLAAERAKQERQAAAARKKHLDSLVGREEDLWRQVEALVESKRPQEYDRAVQLLTDLHDLGVSQDSVETFGSRLDALRERYATRRGLLARLDEAGLDV